jgi:hypothetical protein
MGEHPHGYPSKLEEAYNIFVLQSLPPIFSFYSDEPPIESDFLTAKHTLPRITRDQKATTPSTNSTNPTYPSSTAKCTTTTSYNTYNFSTSLYHHYATLYPTSLIISNEGLKRKFFHDVISAIVCTTANTVQFNRY